MIDRTRSKRAVIVIASLLVTASCLLLPFVSAFSLMALTRRPSSQPANGHAAEIGVHCRGPVGDGLGALSTAFGLGRR